ncbi:MAG: GGDEF domain-containing protein [Atribacterota bacterium]|nr:GGDEF domain-containing protein [Atribacterota bacterium]
MAKASPHVGPRLAHFPLLFVVWKRFPEDLFSVEGGLDCPGLSREILERGGHLSAFIHRKDREAVLREKKLFLEDRGLQVVFRYRLAGEPPVWVEEWVAYNARRKRYESLIQNVTAWKERESELLLEWRLNRQLFEASPLPLWEEDFSALKGYVNALKARGVEELGRYLDSHQEEVAGVVRQLRILEANSRVLMLCGVKNKKELRENLGQWINPYAFSKYRAYLLAIARGEYTFEWEEESQNLSGVSIHVHYKWQVVPGYEKSFARVVVMAIDITKRKALEEFMAHQAAHDPLTGLLNRTAFLKEAQDILSDQRKKGKRFALFFLDLDGFKKVNDFFGHQAGDEVLRLFALRLKKGVRQTDLLARFGGDEFLLLQRDIVHSKDTERIEQILKEVMAEEFVLQHFQIKLSLSVGIAIYPDDAQTLEDLVRIADSRMYQTKEEKLRLRDEFSSESS